MGQLFYGENMTREELKEKARSLPMSPGVYLMQDKSGTIIYVGKAKKLKNRVSQYFADLASHSPKTRLMVSMIDSFDVIAAASEFEALILECSLIKRHMPKYNILLKDDKGFPYLRLDMREEYPTLRMENYARDDGAAYYGPFGSRGATQQLLDTIRLTFKLPGCSKKFPRDLGKDRPCLNYHMGTCNAWCQLSRLPKDYYAIYEQIQRLLKGDYRALAAEITEEMQQASENLEFERAAELRDRLRSIESLGQRQLVTAGSMSDTDVIGYYQTEAKACFVVLHYLDGDLVDKDYEILSVSDSREEAVSSVVKQYYLQRRAAPKLILLPCVMEDADEFAKLLQQELDKKVRIHMPQRGDQAKLVDLAVSNAKQEAERVTSREERLAGTLTLLQSSLGLEKPPRRIEAYDISNMGSDSIVASMTVFVDAKPLKRDYKRFKLKDMDGPDDYASMRQVLHRRFAHYLAGDKGFDEKPDLLLIDGGDRHAKVVQEELADMGLTFPIYGMVKDDRHRTRALISPDGEQFAISAVPALFAFVGRIQEETHRFAITYHRELRGKRQRHSELEDIAGVGEKRRQDLMKAFKSIKAIRAASYEELSAVVPKNAARAVYDHFHAEEEKEQ